MAQIVGYDGQYSVTRCFGTKRLRFFQRFDAHDYRGDGAFMRVVWGITFGTWFTVEISRRIYGQ